VQYFKLYFNLTKKDEKKKDSKDEKKKINDKRDNSENSKKIYQED